MFLWRSAMEEKAVILEDAISAAVGVLNYAGDNTSELQAEKHKCSEIEDMEERVKALHLLYRKVKRIQQKEFNGAELRKRFMEDKR